MSGAPIDAPAPTASHPPGTAVVTGASSGIGAATASALAAVGFRVLLGARRLDRIRQLASELGADRARALPLDVTADDSVAAFVAGIPADWRPISLLVNNAGGALGADRVEDASPDVWRRMYEVNVLGALRMTRALLGDLRAHGAGQILHLGSVSAFETYPGGAGYCGVKHAARAFTRTLRQELLGESVRVTAIDPGLVETEFALVRFDGDANRAKAVYRGMTPLVAADVAACVVFAATRPPHVDIDEIVIRPRDQASALEVYRRNLTAPQPVPEPSR
jgi:NADP-dependent 3-hydroxy acid dehydrogenase YdfG